MNVGRTTGLTKPSIGEGDTVPGDLVVVVKSHKYVAVAQPKTIGIEHSSCWWVKTGQVGLDVEAAQRGSPEPAAGAGAVRAKKKPEPGPVIPGDLVRCRRLTRLWATSSGQGGPEAIVAFSADEKPLALAIAVAGEACGDAQSRDILVVAMGSFGWIREWYDVEEVITRNGCKTTAIHDMIGSAAWPETGRERNTRCPTPKRPQRSCAR